jgi:hypothetical protein
MHLKIRCRIIKRVLDLRSSWCSQIFSGRPWRAAADQNDVRSSAVVRRGQKRLEQWERTEQTVDQSFRNGARGGVVDPCTVLVRYLIGTRVNNTVRTCPRVILLLLPPSPIERNCSKPTKEAPLLRRIKNGTRAIMKKPTRW